MRAGGKNCQYKELLAFLRRYPEWFTIHPNTPDLPQKITVTVNCGEPVFPMPMFEKPHGNREFVPQKYVVRFRNQLYNYGVIEREK
jgi:hypothetical protein